MTDEIIFEFGNPVGKMPYGKYYRFNSIKENSRCVQVLRYMLQHNDVATRRELNTEVFKVDETVEVTEYDARLHCCKKRLRANGWGNGLIAWMKYAGLITYNKSSRVWELGPNVEKFISLHIEFFNDIDNFIVTVLL